MERGLQCPNCSLRNVASGIDGRAHPGTGGRHRSALPLRPGDRWLSKILEVLVSSSALGPMPAAPAAAGEVHGMLASPTDRRIDRVSSEAHVCRRPARPIDPPAPGGARLRGGGEADARRHAGRRRGAPRQQPGGGQGAALARRAAPAARRQLPAPVRDRAPARRARGGHRVPHERERVALGVRAPDGGLDQREDRDAAHLVRGRGERAGAAPRGHRCPGHRDARPHDPARGDPRARRPVRAPAGRQGHRHDLAGGAPAHLAGRRRPVGSLPRGAGRDGERGGALPEQPAAEPEGRAPGQTTWRRSSALRPRA